MRGLIVATLALLVGLTGCKSEKVEDTSLHRTIGRYQVAGQRDLTDHSVIYYVDTMKGRVCYALIGLDGKDAQRCTDSQAFKDGD